MSANGFDPAEDDTWTRVTIVIGNEWEALHDAGHDEAESLRRESSHRKQKELALAHRDEHGLGDEPRFNGSTCCGHPFH